MPVGTYALTSLANLKSWIGISTSTDDAVLEKAIDRDLRRQWQSTSEYYSMGKPWYARS